MTDPLIGSLLRAVEASPQDVPLRLHLAALLLDAGRGAEAAERPITREVDAALREVHPYVVTRTYSGGGLNDSGGNSNVHRT